MIWKATTLFHISESISQWMDFADKNAPENCVKILVGNKCDQESSRIVDYRCGKVCESQ